MRLVIVGAGITGLAAAHHALTRHPTLDVVILESSRHSGGKVGISEVGDMMIDTAADGFLAREPEMADLCREIGLGHDLVSPSGKPAFIWLDGVLRPIPGPSVLGVPLDADKLAASKLVSISGHGAFVVSTTASHPPLVHDLSVGQLVRERVGHEVFENIVDPLLGGINAGRADDMSVRMGAASLARAAEAGGSFIEALREQLRLSPPAQPVFYGLRGGSGRIIDRLADEQTGRLYLSTPVSHIDHSGEAWKVHTPRGVVNTDLVLLATPAPASARLLEQLAPDAAATVGAINYSAVAMATFVYPRDRVAHDLNGSGFLVPRTQPLLTTASSWASSKWEHYNDGTNVVIRVSTGRIDDHRFVEYSDDELTDALSDELALTIGAEGPPLAARVTRWDQALPQFRPGHLDRIDQVEAQLDGMTPGLTATGSAFRGLGLPACVRQGRAAVEHLVASGR